MPPEPEPELRPPGLAAETQTDLLSLSGLVGACIERPAPGVSGDPLALDGLVDCTVTVTDHGGDVTVSGCTGCTVVLGPSQKVTIRNCTQCTFHVAACALRLRGVSDCALLVWTPADDAFVIEDAHTLAVGPWHLTWLGIRDHFAAMAVRQGGQLATKAMLLASKHEGSKAILLERLKNHYAKIHDSTPRVRPRPHYVLTPPAPLRCLGPPNPDSPPFESFRGYSSTASPQRLRLQSPVRAAPRAQRTPLRSEAINPAPQPARKRLRPRANRKTKSGIAAGAQAADGTMPIGRVDTAVAAAVEHILMAVVASAAAEPLPPASVVATGPDDPTPLAPGAEDTALATASAS